MKKKSRPYPLIVRRKQKKRKTARRDNLMTNRIGRQGVVWNSQSVGSRKMTMECTLCVGNLRQIPDLKITKR